MNNPLQELSVELRKFCLEELGVTAEELGDSELKRRLWRVESTYPNPSPEQLEIRNELLRREVLVFRKQREGAGEGCLGCLLIGGVSAAIMVGVIGLFLKWIF